MIFIILFTLTFVGLALLTCGVFAYREWKIIRRYQLGMCIQCGYPSLNNSTRCSECGCVSSLRDAQVQLLVRVIALAVVVFVVLLSLKWTVSTRSMGVWACKHLPIASWNIVACGVDVTDPAWQAVLASTVSSGSVTLADAKGLHRLLAGQWNKLSDTAFNEIWYEYAAALAIALRANTPYSTMTPSDLSDSGVRSTLALYVLRNAPEFYVPSESLGAILHHLLQPDRDLSTRGAAADFFLDWLDQQRSKNEVDCRLCWQLLFDDNASVRGQALNYFALREATWTDNGIGRCCVGVFCDEFARLSTHDRRALDPTGRFQELLATLCSGASLRNNEAIRSTP